MGAVLHRVSSFTGRRTLPAVAGNLDDGANAQLGPTILVVEDEPVLRTLLAERLRDAGYAVVEAADADEALEVLAHSFDIKLVLSDIQMPGSMDGLGLAHVIRSAYPAVKIVLTSGFAAPRGAEHDGFFPKPCDETELISRIRKLLG